MQGLLAAPALERFLYAQGHGRRLLKLLQKMRQIQSRKTQARQLRKNSGL